MAVLGKRLRSSRESTTLTSLVPSSKIDEQPPRKRTRSTAPQIFEDADADKSVKCRSNAFQNYRLANSRRGRIPTLKSGLAKTQHQSSEDVDLPDACPGLHGEQDENVSPSNPILATPSTQRFKDVLGSSPCTPKHRVRAVGGLLTPRTPRSADSMSPKEHNIYGRARQLFTQSAAPAKLIGRDTERQQLKDFVKSAKTANVGGCTYISGPPGTGKSALVHEVMQGFEKDEHIRISVVNCVGFQSATQVYGKLLEDLSPNAHASKGSPEVRLRQLFINKLSKTRFVVMLDEIDSLIDAECETLYNIFEWALHPSSSLSLIGIANALDLTDRFLPRLKAKGLKPHLLPFLPYTAQQISTIITDKLKSLLPSDFATADFVPCMHPAAIQLCGKKIAAQTGDLRKAFNLVRRTIDQVEKETLAKQMQSSSIKQPLGEATNTAAQSQPQTQSKIRLNLSAESAPRATIAHVAKLASSIFNNGTLSRLSGLNLQQKAVLCSIVNREVRRQERDPFTTPTKTATKAPTVAELFIKYATLCKRDDGLLQPLKDTEFRDVVASLETLGLVHESRARTSTLLTPSSSSRGGRNNDDRQVVSAVAEKEMRESLNGPGADLLRRLLDEY